MEVILSEREIPPDLLHYFEPIPSKQSMSSTWQMNTQPFPSQHMGGEKLDHFAVFPTELPRRCILAATSEKGNCSKCGKPWVRVTEGQGSQFNIRVRDVKAGRATPKEGYKATELEMEGYPGNHPDPGYRNTLGWQPQCKCNAEIVPPIVLDPFSGAGTTGLVAKQLGRRAILIDTSEDYCTMSRRRIEEVPIPMML